FVGRLSMTATQFLKHGEAPFRVVPLEELHLRSVGQQMQEVAASPLLRCLTGLDLSGNELDLSASEHLVSSRHLTRLRSLSLQNTDLAKTVGIFASWPGLEHIRALDLERNRLSRVDLGALLEAGRLTEPHCLNLGGNPLSRESVRLLAESPRLRQLTDLGLGFCEIREEDISTLASSKTLVDLRHLDLSGEHPGQALQDFVCSRLAGQLTSLAFQGCNLTDAEIAVLANSPNLSRLRHLDLGRNAIGDEGVQALASSRYLANLEALILEDNSIGPNGATALAASPHLTRLKKL